MVQTADAGNCLRSSTLYTFPVLLASVTPAMPLTAPFRCAAVYFVQGILGLSRLATSFFFKDDLHIDPAEVRFACTKLVSAAVSNVQP